jgi:threonine aldolase
MLGGAMRQSGIFAAAGLYALEHNMDRLSEDHANARLIAERITQSPRVVLDLASVQTNILVFQLANGAPDSGAIVAATKKEGVLLFPFGPTTLRLVTHLDVTRAQCERAADILYDVISRG